MWLCALFWMIWHWCCLWVAGLWPRREDVILEVERLHDGGDCTAEAVAVGPEALPYETIVHYTRDGRGPFRAPSWLWPVPRHSSEEREMVPLSQVLVYAEAGPAGEDVTAAVLAYGSPEGRFMEPPPMRDAARRGWTTLRLHFADGSVMLCNATPS